MRAERGISDNSGDLENIVGQTTWSLGWTGGIYAVRYSTPAPAYVMHAEQCSPRPDVDHHDIPNADHYGLEERVQAIEFRPCSK